MPRFVVVVEVVDDEPERYAIQGGRWNVVDEQFLGQGRHGYNFLTTNEESEWVEIK